MKSQDTHDFEHRIEGRPVSAAKRAIEGCSADIRLSGNLNNARSNHSEIDCTANATEIICRKSRSKGLLHFTRHRNYRNSAPRPRAIRPLQVHWTSGPRPINSLSAPLGKPLAVFGMILDQTRGGAKPSAAAHQKFEPPGQLTAGGSQTFGIRSCAGREPAAGPYPDP